MCILNFVDYLVVLKHIKQFSEGKVAAQKRTFRFLHIIVTSKSVNAFVGAFLAFIAVYPLAVITLDFVRSVLQHDFSHEYVLFSCFFFAVVHWWPLCIIIRTLRHVRFCMN